MGLEQRLPHRRRALVRRVECGFDRLLLVTVELEVLFEGLESREGKRASRPARHAWPTALRVARRGGRHDDEQRGCETKGRSGELHRAPPGPRAPPREPPSPCGDALEKSPASNANA